MKKIIFLTLILTLLLAACGSKAEPATETSAGAGFDQNSQELPLSTKLAIGTLKLENTDLDVTSDQAAELLPLWQVYQSLSTSDTSAQEEQDALVEQIQEAMTPDQMQAITDMQLTQQDVFAVMQEQGLTTGRGQGAGPNGQGDGGFTPPEGGFPGGGPGGEGGGFPGGGPGGNPGGGGGGFGGEGLNQDQIATAQASRAEGRGAGFGNSLITPLVEAVIDLLKSKTGS